MIISGSTTLPELVSSTHLFLGGKDNPLLAPRGVCLAKGKLLVSDTGQNRVFIWNQLPTETYAEPDIVLGQVAATDTARNAGGAVNASTLLYPSGVWSDGEKLILADAWNHRVLIWHQFPEHDGQAADVVIGQPDFFQNQPNVKGVAATPSAQTLYWPYGVFSDGKQLWIADTGNRRVLYFAEIPRENFTKADGLIGKADFNQRDYEPQSAIWPYSVKVSPQGSMSIIDTQYYRALIWNDWKKALSNSPADVIIGQASFAANGQNQFQWFPDKNTLNWSYDTCFYQDGIWVADTGNSRLLWFDNIPQKHNTNADNLLGQDDFNTGSENKNTIKSTEDSYYWPFSVSIEQKIMVVADTGNHRICIHKLH